MKQAISSIDRHHYQFTALSEKPQKWFAEGSMYPFTQLSRHIFLNMIISSTHICNFGLIVQNLVDIKIMKNI